MAGVSSAGAEDARRIKEECGKSFQIRAMNYDIISLDDV